MNAGETDKMKDNILRCKFCKQYPRVRSATDIAGIIIECHTCGNSIWSGSIYNYDGFGQSIYNDPIELWNIKFGLQEYYTKLD